MDFVAVVLFLGLYFLRPQDLISFMAGFPIIRPVVLLGMFGTLNRAEGFNLGMVMRTPHDWVMAAYLGYVILTADDMVGQARGLMPFAVFYFMTMLALSTRERMTKYLKWWVFFIFVIALMATSTTWGLGINFNETVEKTALNGGRLELDTWMHNNPNSLGHSVVAAIPLLYFLYIWRCDVPKRIIGVGMLVLCAWCVVLTESKGAFLVGFMVIAASQMFGRPRIVQLIVAIFATTIGLAMLTQLPRMQTLTRADEGIQGRLIAWEMAYYTMKEETWGVGWQEFVAEYMWERQWVTKATHSSYVQIGASLGYTGLWFFCAVLYTVLRTTLQAKSRNEEEERIRRVLFVLISSYMLSSWMIDRAYHTEYFLTVAVAGAFHRLLYFKRVDTADDVVFAGHDLPELERQNLEWQETVLATQAAGGFLTSEERDPNVYKTAEGAAVPFISGGDYLDRLSEEERQTHRGTYWKRFGVADFLLVTALFMLVVRTWKYIIENL